MATSNELIGRVLGGRYRLRALIGTGASAQVYLADDATLRRPVAVKVLHASLATDETFLRRFRKEAQSAAALNNPNVLAVYDWGHDDLPYIVAEYLAGGSLRAMLDAGHRLSLSQTLLVGLEAARGLEYAHRRGLVHRDIKPANLLFDEDRRLRIADFGLARALAEAGVTEPVGSVVGTARYASPEQARGLALTAKTDVYSLALTLIECVTGDVPFVADTTLGSLLARLDQPIPVPAALGPLRTAIERAGRPDPAERPDAEEFAIALMAAAEDLPRPEPLPVVGALTSDVDTARIDLTLVQPLSADEVPAPSSTTPTTESSTSAAAAPDLSRGDDVAASAGAVVVTDLPLPTVAALVGLSESASADNSDAWSSLTTSPTRPVANDDDDLGGRRWPWILLGVLLLAGAGTGGVIAYFANRTVSHTVPVLIHHDRRELVALAAKNRWLLAEPSQTRSDEFAVDQITDVVPAAGTRVAEGHTIKYTVCIGPKLVPIPKLVGRTLDEAKADLEASRLTLGTPLHSNDENVALGKIIAIDTLGSEAAPSTPIVVKVSDGPSPRAIPAVAADQTEDAINKALVALKLVPAHGEEFNDTVKLGMVIRLDPVSGTAVARDSTVQVIVSKGPEPKPIPNVFGKSAQQAAAILRAAGFDVGDTKGPADKLVIATDPPAGELRPPGTKVNIITRTT